MENWKDIPGFKGRYAVSDLGRVLRKKRISRIGRNLPERLFVPQVALRGGYLMVSLVGGSRRTISIHSLVLLAFVGPRPKRHDANHLNGIRTDNRLSNLEYCTRSENELHKKRILMSSVGSQCFNAKLKESDIPKIRGMGRGGMSHQLISNLFKVSRRLIGGIINRTRWRHVI